MAQYSVNNTTFPTRGNNNTTALQPKERVHIAFQLVRYRYCARQISPLGTSKAAEYLQLKPSFRLQPQGHSSRGALFSGPVQCVRRGWEGGCGSNPAWGRWRAWSSCQLTKDLPSYGICWPAFEGPGKASDRVANTPGAGCWCFGR